MNKIKLYQLIGKINNCIKSGTQQDFETLMPQIELNINFRRYDVINGITTLECYMCTVFLAAYAEKYPESFGKIHYTSLEEHIQAAAFIETAAGNKAAYTISDLIKNDFDPHFVFANLLETAVRCGNYSYFEHYVGQTDTPSDYASMALVNYLFANKKYSCLDKLFKNVTREKLIELCSLNNAVSNDDYRVENIYELGKRYLPEIRNSSDLPGAESEFLCDTGISRLLEFPYDTEDDEDSEFIRTWNFMKEHGLKFRNISMLSGAYSDDKYEQEKVQGIIKKYILPILDDEVYIDILSANLMLSIERRCFLDAVRLIGADRIYIDFTERHFPVYRWLDIEDVSSINEFRISDLLHAGMKVRLDEDIAHSQVIEPLIRSSKVLDYVLEKSDISDKELFDLIDLCIEKKCIESLNIIRKHIERQKSD